MTFCNFCFILCCGMCLIDVLLSSCPHTMLQHGKIRYSYRGRKMRFTCFKPYTLIGNTKLECENGEWNGPMPVCASKNCPGLPDLLHGHITYFNYKALAKLRCNPNFTLVGSSQMHCEVDGWNDTVNAECQANSLHQFGICHFEPNDTKQCEWISKSGFFNWTLTSSRSEDNAHMAADSFPSRDHTTHSAFGHFLYLEALVAPTKKFLSEMSSEKAAAKLISPLFPPLDKDEPHCLIFYLYASKPHAGVVEVLINEDSIWRSNGSLGTEWKKINIPLRNRSSKFRIIIKGKGELGHFTKTAIDDLRTAVGEECQENYRSKLFSNGAESVEFSTKTFTEINNPITSTIRILNYTESENEEPLDISVKQPNMIINNEDLAKDMNSFIKVDDPDSITELIITQNNITFHNSAENKINDSGTAITDQEIHENVTHDHENDNELQINIPTFSPSSNGSSTEQNTAKENQAFHNDMSLLGQFITNSTEKISHTSAENITHRTIFSNYTAVKTNDAINEDDHQEKNDEDDIDEKSNDHRHLENMKNNLQKINNQNNEIKQISTLPSKAGSSDNKEVLWVVLLVVSGGILSFIIIVQIYKKSYFGKRRKDESSIKFIKKDDVGEDPSQPKDDVLVFNGVVSQ